MYANRMAQHPRVCYSKVPSLESIEEETAWDLMEGAPIDCSEAPRRPKRELSVAEEDDETVVRDMFMAVGPESWERETHGDWLNLSPRSSQLDRSLAGVGFDYSLDLPSFVPRFILDDKQTSLSSASFQEDEEEAEELGNWYGGGPRRRAWTPSERVPLGSAAHVSQLEKVTEELHQQLPREAPGDAAETGRLPSDDASSTVDDEELEQQLWQMHIGRVQREQHAKIEQEKRTAKQAGLKKAKEKILRAQQDLLETDRKTAATRENEEEVEWKQLLGILSCFPSSMLDIVMKGVLSFLLDDSCPESISMRKELERRLLISPNEPGRLAKLSRRSASVDTSFEAEAVGCSPPPSPSSVLPMDAPTSLPRSASEPSMATEGLSTDETSYDKGSARLAEDYVDGNKGVGSPGLRPASASTPWLPSGSSLSGKPAASSTAAYMAGVCWKVASSPSLMISAALMGTLLRLRRARTRGAAMLLRK
mmetsp:Transcript_2485/g.8921  ORF Transcript_2485/g.8921 Transcript_2485/m.8921 type:complete len:479 (-) Transcript_2485:2122-3558(-)